MQYVGEMNEQLVNHITELAAQAAIQMFHKTKAVAEQEEKSKRLYNTKQLMKHYVELNEYLKKKDTEIKGIIVPKIAVDKSENIIDLITFGDDIVGSLKKNTQATIVMIRHLNMALETLKHMYQLEDNVLAYNIMKSRYIDKMPISMMCERYNMVKSNIYKVIDKVLVRLSVLLFGIYGVKVV